MTEHDEARTKMARAAETLSRLWPENLTLPFANAIRSYMNAANAVIEEPEWEWACRDEAPTSHFGTLYNVGQPEEVARSEAKAWGDTLLRRRKAGPWVAIPADTTGDPQ